VFVILNVASHWWAVVLAASTRIAWKCLQGKTLQWPVLSTCYCRKLRL